MFPRSGRANEGWGLSPQTKQTGKRFPLSGPVTAMQAEMGPVGFEPTTNQLCFPLQLSLSLSSLWAGLSLYPEGVPAVESLHLRLLEEALGSGLPYPVEDVGFPEFDRCLLPDCSLSGPL